MVTAIVLVVSGCPFDREPDPRVETHEKALRVVARHVDELRQRVEALESKRSTKTALLEACLDDAEDAYWRYVRLNGGRERKNKPGIWRARSDVFENADRKKSIAIERCKTLYGSP